MTAIHPISFDSDPGSASVEEFGPSLCAPVRSRFALIAKRTEDVVGAAVGMILLLPVFLLLALLVKLQDGGPIFHRRRVIGPRGPFDALKFRSMRPDADAVLQNDVTMRQAFQRNFKLKDD